MPVMKQLVVADIVLGEPLPFSIFDERGNLLLRKGIAITMPDQVDRLVARGALIEDIRPEAGMAGAGRPQRPVPMPVAAPAEPAFERMASLALNLKHIVATSLRAPEQIDLPARIGKLARTIQELCREDLDSTLAAPYLDYQNPYIIVHQLMGAVLTEAIAERKGVETEQRVSMVCAALTRDWGQLSMQAELDSLAGPLPEVLKQRVREHPTRGTEMLEQVGVRDVCWLDSINGHHERLDGSGYPRQLQGDAIPLGARVLAIADEFSAMGKPRPYRNRVPPPQNALREIYLKAGAGMDGELVNLMIRQIGMLPPGTIVKLKCGEIAVIKSPTQKADQALVYSVYSKSGSVMPAPVPRNTAQPEYEIIGMVPFSECKSAAITIKRVWLGR